MLHTLFLCNDGPHRNLFADVIVERLRAYGVTSTDFCMLASTCKALRSKDNPFWATAVCPEFAAVCRLGKAASGQPECVSLSMPQTSLPVRLVSFSPSGEWLIAVNIAGNMHGWNTKTGDAREIGKLHRGSLSVTWSADSTFLSTHTSIDGTMLVIRVKDWSIILRETSTDPYSEDGIKWHPTRNVLCFCKKAAYIPFEDADAMASIFVFVASEGLRHLGDIPTSRVYGHFSWADDGGCLAIFSGFGPKNGRICIYDADTLAVRTTIVLGGLSLPYNGKFTLSPGPGHLAAIFMDEGDARTLHLYDTATGNHVHSLSVQSEYAWSPTVPPRLVFTDADYVNMWTNDGTRSTQYSRISRNLPEILWSSDGTMFCFAEEFFDPMHSCVTISVWDASSMTIIAKVDQTFQKIAPMCIRLSGLWSPTAPILVAVSDGQSYNTVRSKGVILSFANRRLESTREFDDTRGLGGMQISSSGKLMATVGHPDSGQVHVWKM